MYFRKSRYFLQKILFFSNICKAIGQYLSPYNLTVLEVVVHIGSLLPMQFSYELLYLSVKHRLYLIRWHYPLRRNHFQPLGCTPLRRDSR